MLKRSYKNSPREDEIKIEDLERVQEIETKIENYKQGASLRSWQEYFPNAMIYGGDIQEDTQFEENRIK